MPKSNEHLTIEQILARTATNSNGCKEWLFWKTDERYPRMKINGKAVLVHRRIAELAYGKPDDALMIVMHSCDNPPCIEPSHLSWGTHFENQRDKVNKNRQAQGRNHGRAKFTFADVEEVKRLKDQGLTLREISNVTGISKSQVHVLYRTDK